MGEKHRKYQGIKIKMKPFLFLGRLSYRLMKRYLKKEKIREDLRKLHVVSKQELERMCDEYYIALLAKVIAVFMFSLLFSVCICMKYASSDRAIVLERDKYGGVTDKLELETKIGEDVTTFLVDVLPVTYEAEQIESVFEQGFAYLDSSYLGENQSADEICFDLKLVDEIPEMGLQVTWKSDQYGLINGRGKISSDPIDTPVLVTLTATLHYEDYSAERQYPVRLLGKSKTEVDMTISKIIQYIYHLQEESPNVRNIEVPENIYGYQISKSKGTNPGLILLLLGIVFSVMIMIKGQSDVKEKTLLRNDALLVEYPTFVERLSLYMGAGLTIRKALMKIAFENTVPVKEQYRNILYEEIKYTLNEIQSGIPEGDAYYQLGHRLNLSVYIKITSLLSQNLKKGTKDILDLLAEEERSAFQMRKELAKKKGEEAGTRLLLPMVLLLGVVIVIIVFPALMSF